MHCLFAQPVFPLSLLCLAEQAFSVQYEGEEASRPYLLKDGSATATFPNTDSYTGGYVERRKHGSKAVYKFASCSANAQYEGSYVSGQRQGQGSLSYPDGSLYSGEWAAGKREGWGRYVYSNGDVWVGEWKDGLRHGSGVYCYRRDGSQFSGVWQQGQCRQGVWSYLAGTERKAEVKDGKVTRYL